MKKNSRFIIFASVAVILIAAIVIYSKQKTRFNWYENYDIKSKDPYGTYVIHEMLKGYYPKNKFKAINTSLSDFLKKNKNHDRETYVFIGDDFKMDSADANSLLEYVKGGNAAYISSKNIDYKIFSVAFPDTCVYEDDYYSRQEVTVGLNFYQPSLKREKDYSLTYLFRNQPYTYSWSYFDSSYLCGENNSAIALGYIKPGYINFITKHYGKGDFYFHSSPLIFTNYALTKEENLEYASKAFSYLPQSDIIWDEFSKLPGNVDFNPDLKLSQSPIQYILSQESLRWAWYITLLLLLLYAVFFSKRRQRIIPVLEPHTNTSLEFINTIGQLYYQQQNHKVICIHKIKLFRNFVRQRYGINTLKVNDAVFKQISVKSQVPFENIQTLFYQFNSIDRDLSVSEEELIQFHQSIENFYKNCK